MWHLIDQCVYVDKLVEQKQKIILDKLNIPNLMRIICTELFESDRIQFEYLRRSELFYSNEILIHVILTNLLDNALKYSPSESLIYCHIYDEIQEEKNGLSCVITNEINAENLPEPLLLFSKYYRAANAKHERGMGLGLWLVRELTERLKGKMDCIYHKKWIEFHLWLPVLSLSQNKKGKISVDDVD